MKNRLSDVNDRLFAQIERLSDDSLTAEEIDREAKRCRAVVSSTKSTLRSANLQIKTAKRAFRIRSLGRR